MTEKIQLEANAPSTGANKDKKKKAIKPLDENMD
jgi:hypothetical protein